MYAIPTHTLLYLFFWVQKHIGALNLSFVFHRFYKHHCSLLGEFFMTFPNFLFLRLIFSWREMSWAYILFWLKWHIPIAYCKVWSGNLEIFPSIFFLVFPLLIFSVTNEIWIYNIVYRAISSYFRVLSLHYFQTYVLIWFSSNFFHAL